jgi:hypothetical protein
MWYLHHDLRQLPELVWSLATRCGVEIVPLIQLRMKFIPTEILMLASTLGSTLSYAGNDIVISIENHLRAAPPIRDDVHCARGGQFCTKP